MAGNGRLIRAWQVRELASISLGSLLRTASPEVLGQLTVRFFPFVFCLVVFSFPCFFSPCIAHSVPLQTRFAAMAATPIARKASAAMDPRMCSWELCY